MKSRLLLLLGLALSAISFDAEAQLQDENLLAPMPQGFKVATNQEQNRIVFQEWIPANETVESWSEMVTVQILLGRSNVDGGKYLAAIRAGWLKACPQTKPNAVEDGRANGYPLWTMMLQCALHPRTGKPETTLFRSIAGSDSFYSVQRSARAVPDGAQMAKMAAYMERVIVCDTRSAGHPCPDLKGHRFQPVR